MTAKLFIQRLGCHFFSGHHGAMWHHVPYVTVLPIAQPLDVPVADVTSQVPLVLRVVGPLQQHHGAGVLTDVLGHVRPLGFLSFIFVEFVSHNTPPFLIIHDRTFDVKRKT